MDDKKITMDNNGDGEWLSREIHEEKERDGNGRRRVTEEKTYTRDMQGMWNGRTIRRKTENKERRYNNHT